VSQTKNIARPDLTAIPPSHTHTYTHIQTHMHTHTHTHTHTYTHIHTHTHTYTHTHTHTYTHTYTHIHTHIHTHQRSRKSAPARKLPSSVPPRPLGRLRKIVFLFFSTCRKPPSFVPPRPRTPPAHFFPFFFLHVEFYLPPWPLAPSDP